jgi:hypothetical protein
MDGFCGKEIKNVPQGLKRVCANRKETADLSTPLRSGRDDKVVLRKLRFFQSMHGHTQLNNLVISTGAQRSGEICGFFFSSHADFEARTLQGKKDVPQGL